MVRRGHAFEVWVVQGKALGQKRCDLGGGHVAGRAGNGHAPCGQRGAFETHHTAAQLDVIGGDPEETPWCAIGVLPQEMEIGVVGAFVFGEADIAMSAEEFGCNP